MPDYNVGPGIRDKMAELGDTPQANSHFHTVEIARGERYTYHADNASGEWRIIVEPAGGTVAPTPIPAIQAKWVGSPNHYDGREGHTVRAIVIHTMVGTLAGCDAEFRNAATEKSAHYGVGLNGAVHQYVALENAAWANGVRGSNNRWPFGSANPNYLTVSIETEDNKDPALLVSAAQYTATLALCRMIRATFPTITHLVAHRVIDTGRSCPGPRWVESGKMAQLARDSGLTLLV
jgi:hypothetical protein